MLTSLLLCFTGLPLAWQQDEMRVSVPSSSVQAGQRIVLNAALERPAPGAEILFFAGTEFLGRAKPGPDGVARLGIAFALPGEWQITAASDEAGAPVHTRSRPVSLTVVTAPPHVRPGILSVPGLDPADTVRLGDFNGDSILDILAAGPGGVRLFPRQDDGTFGEALTVWSGPARGALEIADLNRDGLDDAVLASGSGLQTFCGARWSAPLRQVAHLTRAIANGGRAPSLTVGDADNDGWPDVMVSSADGPALFAGHGGCAFGPARAASSLYLPAAEQSLAVVNRVLTEAAVLAPGGIATARCSAIRGCAQLVRVSAPSLDSTEPEGIAGGACSAGSVAARVLSHPDRAVLADIDRDGVMELLAVEPAGAGLWTASIRSCPAEAAAVQADAALAPSLAAAAEDTPSAGASQVLLTPPSAEFSEAGDSLTVMVTSVPSSSWIAQVQPGSSWLTIGGATSGVGNGSILVQATPNSGGTSRTGTITVGGTQLVIRQRATASASLVILSKDSQTFGETGGTVDIQVLANRSAGATPSSDQAWVSVSVVPPGTVTGAIQLRVDGNSVASSRVAQVSYGDARLNVVQAPYKTGLQNVLAGVVRDGSTGQPIAGARLFFYGTGYGYATADANGVYSFTGNDITSFGGALSGTLYVGAPGYFETQAVVPDLSAEPSRPLIRDFTLRPGGTIVRGVVRDSISSVPVAGATVMFSRSPMCSYRGGGTQESVTTAADGTYAIDSSYFNESGLSSGFTLSIQVNASGYLGASRSTGSFTAYLRDENIALTPTSGAVLRGRVTDRTTGQAIAGARLFFYGSGYGYATADANGEYTFTGNGITSFGGALSGTLYAGAPGYFEAQAVVPDLGAQPSLPVIRDFTLRPGGTIVRGLVRDATTSLPVAGATVMFNRSPMCSYRGGGGTQESVTTAADGTYAIDSSYFNESGLTSGFSLSIQVNASGYLGASRSVSTFTASPRDENIALTPTSGAVLRGRITDRMTGQAIAGARLFFYGSGYGYATADANGVYSFTGSGIQSFGGALSGTLYAGAPGYFETHTAIPDLGAQSSLPLVRDLSLQPGGAMARGLVRDASSGAPVAGATVMFSRSPMSTYRGGGTQESVTTAADGTYTIDSSYFNESGLSGGFSLTLQVNANGFLGATRPVSFTAFPRTENFDLVSFIRLEPTSASVAGGSVTGSFNITLQGPYASAPWNVASQAAWITVSSVQRTATGGTVNYSIASNAGTQARAGEIRVTVDTGAQAAQGALTRRVARQPGAATSLEASFAVQQAAASGTVSLVPPSATIVAGGGSGTVTVTATGSYSPWSATNTAAWLTVTPNVAAGTFTWTAAANPWVNPRTGTVNVGPAVFTLTQAGATPSYTLAESSANVGAGGVSGASVLLMATPGDAPWTASSNATWLVLDQASTSGTGNAVIRYSCAQNTSSSSRTGVLTIAGQTFTVTQFGTGTPLMCNATAAVPALVRAEGVAELVGDLLLVCNGASPAGIVGDIVLSFSNTPVTSRLVSSAADKPSEALLFLDEPAPGAQFFSGPLATPPAIGTPFSTSYGNVYHGRINAANQIVFSGVPLAPAGASGAFQRVVRITNVRANASQLPVTQTPGQVVSFASVTSAAAVTVANAQQTLAFVQPGLAGPLVTAPAVTPGRSGTVDLAFTERFATAFKKRGGTIETPGTITNTDSGSISTATGLTGSPGLASQGTRLMATFSQVPDGVQFTVPKTVQQGALVMQLVENADANGAGGTLSAGTDTATVTAGSGGALIAYEVIEASPLAMESVTVPVTIAVPSGAAPATAGVALSFGPASNTAIASATEPTPRFAPQTATANAFSVPAVAYTLGAAAANVPAAAGSGSVSLTVTPSDASWTASSNAAWLTLAQSSAGGTGSATIAFNYAANGSANPRTGTLTIGGQTFTVTQAGVAGSVTLSSAAVEVMAGGGSGSIQVTANPADFAWTAVSSASWLTITSGASGTGNGTVGYSVAANGSATRTATITIADQSFVVTQQSNVLPVTPASLEFLYRQGDMAPATTLSVAIGVPHNTFTAFAAGNVPLQLTKLNSFELRAGVDAVAAGALAPGVYTGTITLTASNASSAVVPVRLTVLAPPACVYAFDPSTLAVAREGGSFTARLVTQSHCGWNAASSEPWITVVSPAGTGAGTITFVLASNPGAGQRSGTVMAGGQSLAITQSGGGCAFTVNPTAISTSAHGGSGVIDVVSSASSCAWTATSNVPWVTVTRGASGAGSGSVGITLQPNAAALTRTGTLTVAGQAVTVEQPGTGCSATLSPNNVVIPASGGSGAVNVTVPAGCGYSTSNAPGWFTVTSGASGTGSGILNYTAAPNSSRLARSGALTIGGQRFEVRQEGMACNVSVSASNPLYAAAGGTGSVTVIASDATCSWTAQSNADWAVVTSGGQGAGSGSVTFSVAANTASVARTASLTVAGQTVPVRQSGTMCTIALRSSHGGIPAAGGTGSVGVLAASGCSWTAVSNAGWLTPQAASGSGSSDVVFTAETNPGAGERSGTLTIAGLTYTVTQPGATCNYLLDLLSAYADASGATGTVNFSATTAGCSPAAQSHTNWISTSPPAFSGTRGTVNYTVLPNPTAVPRTGTVLVGDQLFTVSQGPAACAFTLTAPGALFSREGGGGALEFQASAAGCVPAVTASPGITLGALTSSGATYTQNYTVAPFEAFTRSTRRLDINVSGRAFVVKQTSW